MWTTSRLAEATRGYGKTTANPTCLNAKKEAGAQGAVGSEQRARRKMSRAVKDDFAQTPGQDFPIECRLMSRVFRFPPFPASVLRLTSRRLGHGCCKTPGPALHRSAAQEIELPGRRHFDVYWPAMQVRRDFVSRLVKAVDACGGFGLASAELPTP
jgi:hypothetical protein